ncbi:MAG: flavodoxin [bacterium]|nr:flavodoxin [bacterium]
MEKEDRKILVAFFSHKGENYSQGKMVQLEKGNTAVAAELLAEALGGADVFEIRRQQEYPQEYRACVNVAVQEKKDNARPQLAEDVDISAYDVVCLGYPNWCGTMPMPVWTFLENHVWEGKRLLPFCTNEGSGMGNSEKDLKELVVGAEIREGLPIHGTYVKEAGAALREWIHKQL